MDRLQRLLGHGPAPQPRLPRIDTDVVYPLHKTDQSDHLRPTIMVWTLKFNDILDPGLLQKSLTELIEIGDWRKLGGRLRFKDDGDFELHVPRNFTKERPAFDFFHSSFPSVIEDHPVASQFPELSEHPSLYPLPDCNRLSDYPGAPGNLIDYISKDTPILSLHVLSFKNATVVCLRYSHMLMDVMGQNALLQAWCLVLSGNASQVPELLGAREDALGDAVSDLASRTVREEYTLGRKQLKGWQTSMFNLHCAWSAVDKLRERAQNDLATLDKEKSFLSNGDILTAWYAQTLARSLPTSRPISLLQSVNLRFRLAALKGGAYINNLLISGWSTLPANSKQLLLAQLALQFR
ncbi:hypothetical protein BLS_009439 [Venturia inaequalis]|uniref:Uncharacterized protein n=2 Tax=Venturia inaequalis TaxID=5025 RepID=A0A8H3U6W1_VENIN|nr:hypothetical protein BLS_009439 [Venturia inaequalis]